jgi:hypothetical protein
MFMTEQGYSRCHSDHCVYFKRLENGSYIIFLFISFLESLFVSRYVNYLSRKEAKLSFYVNYLFYLHHPNLVFERYCYSCIMF